MDISYKKFLEETGYAVGTKRETYSWRKGKEELLKDCIRELDSFSNEELISSILYLKQKLKTTYNKDYTNKDE